MLLLKILIKSAFLYFTAKQMRLADTTYLTAIKVSLIQGVIMYILSQFNPQMNLLGYVVLLPLIKYFYKIDIKKSIILWLASELLSIIILMILIVSLGTWMQLK